MNSQAPATADLSTELAPPRSVLARMGRAWDRFFFRPADPTTLGMIRICCGLIALYTVAAFSLDLQNFFGRHAWVDLQLRDEWRASFPKEIIFWNWPNEQMQVRNPDIPVDRKIEERWGVRTDLIYSRGTPIWSIWFHVTDPDAMAAVHTACLVIIFLFTIGLCTRLTSVLTWFAMLSYIHRSSNTVFGVDTMMTIVLLYLMIGPSGAALSVDRLIRRWLFTYRSLRQQSVGSAPEPVHVPPLPVTPSVSANLAIRLLQIHLCIVYGAAGLSKLQGSAWWSGEAIWGTLANWEYAPMQYPAYNAFLLFLADHLWLWQLFMTMGTLFTLAFEIGFPFLIWRPGTRWVVIGMAVTLHGGIGLFMGLKTFSMMMLTMVLSFVPPEVLHRWLRALGRGPTGLRLLFSGQTPGSLRAASLVHALDVWDQVELVRTGSGKAEPLRLETATGAVLTGGALRLRLLGALGIFRVFYPWCWFTVLTGRDRGKVPKASPSSPPGAGEPLGKRGPHEPVKTGSPHVKSKR
jgi:hypothetical protein